MTTTAARYLYLTRHGEASPDETELTANGRRQAVLLGERLRGHPISAIHHSPLPRAAQTARLIAEQFTERPEAPEVPEVPAVPLHPSEPAGDYLPYVPDRSELPAETADALLGFLAQFPPEARDHGPALAREALALFTGPVPGDEPRHELVVTHNFLIGWLVRAALDAPDWRWLGLNHANAALTVIRYAPGRLSSVLFYNDMSHLPADLCWTGFPPELRL
ncbi:histidine phosphatase family protein [Streptomyces sp. NBS 14/10]|uniref:histidine phosphatase family protein n=1 Tax=Streptomyces sp. NBS 14/10 TaxID=1945643 RepID=UPI000B7CD807|nr:histidine phosphatase family protein [Streptomyces sp. NBS 14/10]KAK1178860.1 histidine phosphatase family protein [Streptomyces sp. NBS 14/10]